MKDYFKRLRRVTKYPSLLLPMWVYMRLNARVGTDTTRTMHVFFNRWKVIR